jgi:hypothetical protein
MTEHRFPPPWTVEETPACFNVRDAKGQALNYTYYFTEEMSLGGEQYDRLTMLTKDEAGKVGGAITGATKVTARSAKMRREGSRRISPSCRPVLTISLGYRVLKPVT